MQARAQAEWKNRQNRQNRRQTTTKLSRLDFAAVQLRALASLALSLSLFLFRLGLWSSLALILLA